jgi:hypothetical protein
MKRLCFALLLLFGASGVLLAAAGEVDVVHLKDGSVLRGTIVERQTYPQEAVILKTADGLQITIPMDKIARITKEQAGGGAAGASGGAAAGASGAEPHPMGKYAFEINVLGPLQFGPFARFEFQVGDEWFVAPHVRVGYAGLLPWVLFDNPDVGVGVSVLKFFPTGFGNNRFYVGGFGEVSLNMENNILVTGGANAGYRFRFPNRTYWNVGGFAGLFHDTWYDTTYFFGMVELAWGKEF